MTAMLLILVYIVSVYWCWYETNRFFNNLSFVRAEFFEVVTCFVPVVNLISALVYFFDAERCPIKSEFFEKIANCFFKSNAGK